MFEKALELMFASVDVCGWLNITAYGNYRRVWKVLAVPILCEVVLNTVPGALLLHHRHICAITAGYY